MLYTKGYYPENEKIIGQMKYLKTTQVISDYCPYRRTPTTQQQRYTAQFKKNQNRHFSKDTQVAICTVKDTQHHQGNENQNYSELPLQTHQDGYNKRKIKMENNNCWQGQRNCNHQGSNGKPLSDCAKQSVSLSKK